VVTLVGVEQVVTEDDGGNSVSRSLLRVNGLNPATSKASDGFLATLFLVKEVDMEMGTVTVEGQLAGLEARDQIRFINPRGGMEQIVVGRTESVDGNTRVSMEGDMGALDAGWLAMPLFRDQTMPVPVALLSVLGIALLLGVVHGLLVTKIHLQPFVVTLCGLLLYRGISRWLVNDRDTGYGNEYESSLSLLTNGKFELFTLGEPYGTYSIPYAFFIFILVAILAAVFLNKTIYGRYMLALGRNVEAARFSGIDTDRMTIIGYVICTIMGALGGLFFLNYSNSIAPSSHGNFFELYAIAAAVLGGCSLRGGEGSILGVVVGTALMVTLKMFINLMKISDTLEFAIIGIVILVGVIADELLKKAVARRQASKS
jgi:ribose transport system permease protein